MTENKLDIICIFIHFKYLIEISGLSIIIAFLSSSQSYRSETFRLTIVDIAFITSPFM